MTRTALNSGVTRLAGTLQITLPAAEKEVRIARSKLKASVPGSLRRAKKESK